MSSPLDRIEENVGELRRNVVRFTSEEPFLAVVLDDAADNMEALMNVAKAAEAFVRQMDEEEVGDYDALREALAVLDEKAGGE